MHYFYPVLTTTEYKSTKRHTNADGLSRMPVQSCNDSVNIDAEEICHIHVYHILKLCPLRVMLLRAKPAVTEYCHVLMSKL